LAWKVNYTRTSVKQLSSLPRETALKISNLMDMIAFSGKPLNSGKALTGNLAEYWRYRIGNYRIICHIDNEGEEIMVVAIGDRKSIYKQVKRKP